MSGVITRSSLPAFLVEGIKKSFGTSGEKFPSLIKQVFDMETSNKATEVYQEVAGFGRHQTKAENEPSQLDSISQSYETFIRNIAYSLRYQITFEAIEDNLYPEILRNATALGKSAAETKEAVAFDYLNAGFSTDQEHLLADGQPLFSTAHPLPKAGGDGSSTNANRPTTGQSLSEASLTTDLDNIASFKAPSGLKVFVAAELAIVPQALDVKMTKLLNSTLEAATANNAINAFGRGLGRLPKGHVTSQFLSDPNAYFLRTNHPGLAFQERNGVRLMEDFLQQQMANEIVSYMRFGVRAYDHRSVYSNPGQ